MLHWRLREAHPAALGTLVELAQALQTGRVAARQHLGRPLRAVVVEADGALHGLRWWPHLRH